MEMFEFTMAVNSVAVIIVTSAPAYVISGAEIEDEETPEYVLPGAEADKDEDEPIECEDGDMNWEYYSGLRVVTMFNHKAIHKAIEASCEG